MTSGPVPGSSYYLEKAEYFLGRDLANDIPIPDVEISRRHARIFLQGNLVFIEDLGSTNGTFVNGTRISSPKELHQGDVITLAESTKFSFSQSGQAVVTPASQTAPPCPRMLRQVHKHKPATRPLPRQCRNGNWHPNQLMPSLKRNSVAFWFSCSFS